MSARPPIKALFVDIGGVLLTDGWNHHFREAAARKFNLDFADMNARHQLTFDTYEEGKISLNEYLDRIVFYQKRGFSRRSFRTFMFAQSKPFPETISLVRRVKAKARLKVAVVSNEGRELNSHRIRKFKLAEFVDFFISSCFVHFRKPDTDIFKLALDVAQVGPQEVVYIEDRPMFVEVARSLGIRSIKHNDAATTARKLRALGVSV